MEENKDIPEGYTRITEVLAPFAKFDNIPREVLDKASDRGTRVHAFCEAYIKAKPLHAHGFVIDSADEDCKPYLESFVKWFDEYVSEVITTEMRINSDLLKLTGQFDMLCKVKGSDEYVLVDFKTPQTASKTWALQTAAYAFLIRDATNFKVDRRIVVMLSKTGALPKILEYTDNADETRFLCALDLYRFFNGIEV